ncbi:PWWP domain-containing protein 1 [Euphorbia lathyris]|uniref:PWWP domain-containing protein 1 n=1 Tax=Euphorbia lathyris TaxID=212925 RepID=UPI003313AD31
MISNAKKGVALNKKSSAIKERRAEVRVSADGTDSSGEEKPRISGIELDSRAPKSKGVSRVLESNVSMEEVKEIYGAGEESDEDEEMEEESRVFEVKKERAPSFVQFDPRRDEFDASDQMQHARSDAKVEVYNTLLSEFDDFVANEKHGAMEGASRALSYGFEVGDMVWGKVKSHPWWPGHIFNEAFATSSVRRTRREGYVLVAFFGDSSYGWFDPAELIPFDLHFAEKSQQINSRNFIKAVEEAMDEACRRQGLGLACRCRNRYNFRQTNVQGYFEIDVPDYEPRGVYSEIQIKKAWDSFQPGETLSFVKQMAFAPQECNQNTLEFVKNRATVSALRKAVFEEFDETYAQAFGVHSKRVANDPVKVSAQPVKQPTRAPLSGPLVIAEALGGGKNSKKPVKVKDQSKKDRYLIKRRDESVDSKALQIGQKQESSSAPATFEEGSSAVVPGDFVLQKRAPTSTSAKYEVAGTINNGEVACSSEDAFGKTVISDKGPINAQAIPSTVSGAISTPNKVNDVVLEKENKLGSDVGVGSTSTSASDISSKVVPLGVGDGASPSLQQEDVRYESSAKVSKSNEGSQLIENLSARSEGEGGSDMLQDACHGSHPSTPVGLVADVGVKKVKVHKRPLGDLTSGNSIIREKKKKKKKQPDGEATPDQPKKRLAMRTGGPVVGKSTTISATMSEDSQANPHRKDVGSSNASLASTTINTEPEVSHLLSNLHALALDPSHGAARNGPPITMQFFLRFRSFYYQKSPFYFQKNLVSSPPSENESAEIRAKPSSSVAVAENSSGETPSKPMKSLARPDDPTKGGRKRLPSDRQEEIAAKRVKKITQLKSLAAEKKAGQRMETQRTEMKEPVPAAAPPKLFKSNSVKKVAPQARTVEPTMLIMKFPPQTSLPSIAELKAKFIRFGSIDQSAIRVFWATSTCRVVFRHKLDAQAAYRSALANNSLFNDVSVRYSLREVGGAPASEAAEFDKGRGDDSLIDSTRAKDPTVERQPVMHQPLPPQSTIQPKSILKKPTGEEAAGTNGGGGRGTARVKFMLGGEENTSRGEQLMVGNRNFNNNASYADGGGAPTSSTSVAMDFNSKNFQKVIPPSPSPSPNSAPILPLPPQFAKPPINNLHHTHTHAQTRTHTEVVAPRNLHKNNNSASSIVTPPPNAPPTNIDISQQMLTLLTRCNEVVTSVTGLLGYVPYHPL